MRLKPRLTIFFNSSILKIQCDVSSKKKENENILCPPCGLKDIIFSQAGAKSNEEDKGQNLKGTWLLKCRKAQRLEEPSGRKCEVHRGEKIIINTSVRPTHINYFYRARIKSLKLNHS